MTKANNDLRRVPLSVLDLAVVSAGGTSATALADSTRLAQQAERLGYTRFWVAEHHNMPSVASTAPPVLIAHLAASTSSIRVGSGGVMLPNHPSLVVAEQFAMLEALHPGRIDLGIGRAPGTDPATASALRRTPGTLSAEDFPRHLIDLMGLLGDPRTIDGLWKRFAATPVATSAPAIVLLGSSGYSAQLAGQLGLPFAFAHHFDTGGTLQALDLYRQNFTPSAILAQPYAIVTANVLAAASEEEAAWFAGPGRLMMFAVRSGRFTPLLSPEEAAAHPDLHLAMHTPTNWITGAPDSVVEQLEELVRASEADEIMVVTFAHGLAERLRSLELLAHAWHGTPERVERSSPDYPAGLEHPAGAGET
ncbi:MAG TPA: LLM class flavin-dependent oxidoreductase [Caldilineaceae bacterium]|nr:LLM class flavin-dependent oxidoreductase [Caldilineaceae bacterium]